MDFIICTRKENLFRAFVSVNWNFVITLLCVIYKIVNLIKNNEVV